MASTISLLDFMYKTQAIAKEEGIPDVMSGLRFMQRVEEQRAHDNEERRAEQTLWHQKKPAVAEFYRCHPSGEIDPDDVAEFVGLPKSRSNRTRINRELRQLGYDRNATAMAAE